MENKVMAATLADDVALDRALTPEEETAEFRAALDDLAETQSGLASRMMRLGDRRPFASILRGVQRMATGETRVSGEMHALLEMMNRERRRAKFEATSLTWKTIRTGCVTAKTRDFTITLSAQSRGRWHINLVHVDGYRPTWPSWQPDLEEAKIRSIICVEDAQQELQQIGSEG